MIGCIVLPRFYVEAKVHSRPELAGRPVVIHTRGQVFACSPLAKVDGLSPDMPLGQAYMVCPSAEFLPYDEDLYRSAQERVLGLCADYVSVIEPFSRNELFLELPTAGDPRYTAAEIAGVVKAQARFTCQVGAGPSKLVARIAALERPGTVVGVGEEAKFLAPLPLSRLWMLDDESIQHLEALGVHAVGLLQQIPQAHLLSCFGSQGRRWQELAFGRDHSPVRALYPPPIIQVHLSFPGGVQEMTVLQAGLRRLSAEVAAQLRYRGEACRRVGLEIEADDGRSASQWLRPNLPVASEGQIFLAAERLLRRARFTAPIAELTLRATDLQRCAGMQLELLETHKQSGGRQERLAEVLASAQERFGSQGVRWAREIDVPRRERMLACMSRSLW